MSEITRCNHFVPQFYLRQWSEDGNRIWSYRLLVSHENVPEWSHVAIKSIGARMGLYTEVVDGKEADEFEQWVKSTFEDPAAEVLRDLSGGGALGAEEWERLAMFYAAQDVRTPSNLIASLEKWNKELPELLDKTVKESVRNIESAARRGERLEVEPNRDPMTRSFRVVVDDQAPTPPGKVQIRAEVTPGRTLWLGSLRRLLTGVAETLKSHHWSIVEAAQGHEWPTSDHPALRLNYNDPEDYTLEGGWGFPGSDLLMPLTPRYLLFTQVGKKFPRDLQFSSTQTRELQRLLCEKAHREIYSTRPKSRITWFRPRIVNPEMVKHEEGEWNEWHEKQSAIERESELGS